MVYDLIIIGSGPAGYVAAIRAGQTGLKTLVIDKKYVGGMCLNWGCIPSKTLLESAKLYHKIYNAEAFGITGVNPDDLSFDWPKAVKRAQDVIKRLSRGIEFLWKKNGVEFIKAEATILSATQVQAENQIFETKNIMIATGSKPQLLEHNLEHVELEDLLSLETLPEKPLLYGGGSVTFEQAQFFKLLGKKPIIVKTTDTLIPGLDAALTTWIERKLKKDKIPVVPAEEIVLKNKALYHKNDKLDYDTIINTSLRAAVLPPMQISLKLNRGFIDTNEFFESSIAGVYAVGDVNGKSFLAHSASAQGQAVVDKINGKATALDLSMSPINIYSSPEIAQIGKTEQQAKEAGIDYSVGEYNLAANGKALSEGNSEGILRLIYENKYKEVLGVQIIAEHATDMIHEAAILMDMEGTVYELGQTIHAHPTVSEVFMELGQQLSEE